MARALEAAERKNQDDRSRTSGSAAAALVYARKPTEADHVSTQDRGEFPGSGHMLLLGSDQHKRPGRLRPTQKEQAGYQEGSAHPEKPSVK